MSNYSSPPRSPRSGPISDGIPSSSSNFSQGPSSGPISGPISAPISGPISGPGSSMNSEPMNQSQSYSGQYGYASSQLPDEYYYRQGINSGPISGQITSQSQRMDSGPVSGPLSGPLSSESLSGPISGPLSAGPHSRDVYLSSSHEPRSQQYSSTTTNIALGDGSSSMMDMAVDGTSNSSNNTIDLEVATHLSRKFVREFIDTTTNLPLYPFLIHDLVATNERTVNLNFGHLVGEYAPLCRYLTLFPAEALTILEHVFTELRNEMFPEAIHTLDTIRVLPFGLPTSESMRALSSDQMDTLISLRGMVIRVGNIIPQLKVAAFQCVACQSMVHIETQQSTVTEPATCLSCNKRHTMQIIHNLGKYVDKQVIRLQETPDEIPDGDTPNTITLYAYDELVDVIKPGDRVEITGVYRASAVRVTPSQRTLKSIFRTYIDVLHFRRVDNNRLDENVDDISATTGIGHPNSSADGSDDTTDGDDLETNMTNALLRASRLPRYPIQETDTIGLARERIAIEMRQLSKDPNIYNKLVNSLAPSVYEMNDVKKGLLCMLFGGTNNDGAESGRFRGEINVLMCGDPGTSKSQLLQYVHKIAPRGIYTSGKGSSAVGLTAYISRDPLSGELVLESGALVLSDRGVCCIDEFDKMTDSTRSILHEVMEQQTVSIAKAGIVCTLNARTSICASANPKQSRYNPKMSVVKNIELGPTLLSRFDLIFLILDQPNRAADRRLAHHLVKMYMVNFDDNTTNVNGLNDDQDILSLDKLKQYIAFSRQESHPELTAEAGEALVKGYISLRKPGYTESKKTITATPRQLESLIRLAESLARMRLSSFVIKSDVDEALRLMNVATQASATDPTTGKIDMDTLLTGQSSYERRRLDDAREAIQMILQDKAQANVDGNTLHLRVDELLQEFNSMIRDAQAKLTTEEFHEIINTLAVAGVVEVRRGRNGPENIVYRAINV